MRYHGVLASASKHRSAIVPEPKPDEPVQLRLFAKGKPSAQLRARRVRWAKLMAKVFGFDPLCCPRCQSPMRIVEFVTDPAAIAEVLGHAPASSQRPRADGARAPPQLDLPLPIPDHDDAKPEAA